LLRKREPLRVAFRKALLTRSRYIWARSTAAARRGYFLAGLGLEAGHALDAIAAEANELLIQANGALLTADGEAAILAITGIAERVFAFYPFAPDPFPANWRTILRSWLLGLPLAATVAGQEADALQFIEGGLVYRLPWAMEAIRVRAAANGDVIGQFGLSLDDFELGLAVPAVETGTMNRSASMLIQAGFNSRLAAIKAVADTGATFTSGQELRAWLRSAEVDAWSAQPNWPTPETRAMWLEFTRDFAPRDNRTWLERRYHGNAQWYGPPPPPGAPLTLHHWKGEPLVLSADGQPIGRLMHPLNANRLGLIRATATAVPGRVDLSYLGPDDLWTV
jgi:predicted outer membrane lipoprotein